jgi:hypothetical protein
VNAEFNWWLLIVGLVVGAGLVWYVLMDARRREVDVDAVERPREAAWLSATLASEGWDIPPEAADRLLELHRSYLDAPPPDEVDEVPEIADAGDGVPDAGPGAGPAAVTTDSTTPPVESERAGDDGVGLGS